jgi:hypothetical protein
MKSPVLLLSVLLAACCGCGAPAREGEEPFQAGADLGAACRAFYADNGRWPRDVDELEGFDARRLRSVHFHKRLVEGGLEVRYTTPASHGLDPEGRLYLPPPREWSPKGVRTQPATSPTTAPAAG